MLAQEGPTVSLRQINTSNADASLAYPQTTSMLTLNGVAENPVTASVWAIRDDCHLFTVNMTTGAFSLASLTQVAHTGTQTCNGLAIDGSGKLYTVITDTTITPNPAHWATVDLVTGVATFHGLARTSINALSWDPHAHVVRAQQYISFPLGLGWISINPQTLVESYSPYTGVTTVDTLAITPGGSPYVADSSVLKTGNNFSQISSLTTVGFTNNLWPLNGTLFWYQVPAAPLPNTGLGSEGLFTVGALSAIIGSGLVAAALALRRRIQISKKPV